MKTRSFMPSDLEEIGTKMFDAAGSPHEESKTVSEILVRSSLLGHDSHGVIRFVEYSKWVQEGQIVPGTAIETIQETPSTAVLDGHSGWGVLSARRGMQLAMQKARETGVGTVVIRNCMHVGRLGEYSTMPTEARMIGSVFVNSYGGRDMVAPWGGIDPRLAANPLSWAAPTEHDWPFLVDVTTSVVPEGKVRVALQSGKKLPEGCLIDRQGKPTTDPADLYNGGAILPMGGVVGHKGYGLNLVMELLAGALSGAGCRGQQSDRNGNGVFLQAMEIGQFVPFERFIDSVQTLIAHIKSSRRAEGVEEILIPGELEYHIQQQRLRDGIPVSEGTWEQISERAQQLGIEL